MSQVKARKPAKPPDDRAVSSQIRRQAGDRATRRFLSSLPAFKVVAELPEHLRLLLARLEQAEDGQGSRG